MQKKLLLLIPRRTLWLYRCDPLSGLALDAGDRSFLWRDYFGSSFRLFKADG